MADIFERLLKNYGPIGQHRKQAHHIKSPLRHNGPDHLIGRPILVARQHRALRHLPRPRRNQIDQIADQNGKRSIGRGFLR